jgi:hypothetical protein
MLKISSTPSPMLPSRASDVGTHILDQDISQIEISAISISLLYQMACNLSGVAVLGSVRFEMKSKIVRKPCASPGSSPEHSWTIR